MIGGPEIDETHIRYHVVVGLLRVLWGHRMLIIDKCHSQPEKSLFYVRRTSQNGGSRDVLRNWLSTDFYKREGNKVSPRDILGCDVLCLSMADTASFFCGGQINGKVFY
jgi:hypothetical protein